MKKINWKTTSNNKNGRQPQIKNGRQPQKNQIEDDRTKIMENNFKN